jgi:hypothetical protein
LLGGSENTVTKDVNLVRKYLIREMFVIW